MKYIVKNCPAFCDNTRQCRGAYDRKISHQYCSGNNDDNCIIKQIVGLCKETLEQESDPINTLEMSFAQKILNLLEIEEVNE